MDNNTAASLKTTKNRLNVNILLLFPAIKSTDLCTRGRLRMLGFERCFDNALYYTTSSEDSSTRRAEAASSTISLLPAAVPLFLCLQI